MILNLAMLKIFESNPQMRHTEQSSKARRTNWPNSANSVTNSVMTWERMKQPKTPMQHRNLQNSLSNRHPNNRHRNPRT